ncbi:titin [Echinococcus multilocularis]|uniref:Titin n=1 Tax=Echinococcus multilocularis TaxID=6211 RepID=A0A068Y1G3_ECHMU|nr:titin [Echinococcus multilocularis]
MEPQTVYYPATPTGAPQGMHMVKAGGQFVQPSGGGGTTQPVYYASGGQAQLHPQQQVPTMATATPSTTYYPPQPQQNFYIAQPTQYTSPAVPNSPQVYTVGTSPQPQYQQQQSQPQYQNVPQNQPQSQQLFYSPSQQSPSRLVYASSAQAQTSATQYQPQSCQVQYQSPTSQAQYYPPQPASPTRMVQYAPQASYQAQPSQAKPAYSSPPQQQIHVASRQVSQPQAQPVMHQPQQTAYQPAQAPSLASQPPMIRLSQPSSKHQMQQQQQIQQHQYAQNAGQPIDRTAYPMGAEANQQPTGYQPMGRAAPLTVATPPQQQPQQYQPPQQRSLLQSVAAQQIRPVPQSSTQRPPTSPSGATPKLRQLQPRRSMDRGDAEGPPQFIQHPVPQATVNEGDSITLKAIVKPAGDPTLEVQWLKNGVVLSASSRHNAVLDRGYAEFQFLYTNTTDSGEYVCVAKTANGSAQSTSCSLTIVPEDSVVTDSQLPDESMIMNLAAVENQLAMNGTPRREEEVKFTSPPQFLRPLLPQIGLKENERAKFETFVQPANDPSLTVDWFKDGEPLKTGCRFTETMDRGYVILDIHYTYPEDSGQYHCVAKNNAGSTPSNSVELNCKGGIGIVTDSVLSAESVHYLQSLDALEISTSQDQRYTEAEQHSEPPSFELEPKNTTAIEGSPVRLLVKAGGYPYPRVQWLINGDVLPTSGGGGAWRIYNDGGISCLEFNRCGPPGEYTVTAVAKNNLGEAASECSLVIDPQPDYRPDLKHVAPENPFRRMANLKRVERSEELKNAFEKTKPKVLELRKLERRNSQTEGLNDTELMYAQVQASLRSNRRSLQGDPMRASQPASAPAPVPPRPQPQVQYQQQAPTPKPRPPPQPQQPPMQPPQQTMVQQPPAPQTHAQAPTPPLQQQQAPAAPEPVKPQYGLGNAEVVQPNGQYSVTETSAEFQIEFQCPSINYLLFLHLRGTRRSSRHFSFFHSTSSPALESGLFAYAHKELSFILLCLTPTDCHETEKNDVSCKKSKFSLKSDALTLDKRQRCHTSDLHFFLRCLIYLSHSRC